MYQKKAWDDQFIFQEKLLSCKSTNEQINIEDIPKLDVNHIAQKMKFSIKDFFSKCDQILMRIWSHLLKKSLMENFIFCAVSFVKWSAVHFIFFKQSQILPPYNSPGYCFAIDLFLLVVLVWLLWVSINIFNLNFGNFRKLVWLPRIFVCMICN